MQQRFDDTFKSYFGFLDNDYISAVMSIVLILYAGMAAPRLPENIAVWFDNMFVKLVMFFLIAYTGRRNPTVAAIAAVGLMVTLQTVDRYNTNKKLAAVVTGSDGKKEGFAVEMPAVANNAVDDNSEIICAALDPADKHYHQYAKSDMNVYVMKDAENVDGWTDGWEPEFAGVSE